MPPIPIGHKGEEVKIPVCTFERTFLKDVLPLPNIRMDPLEIQIDHLARREEFKPLLLSKP